MALVARAVTRLEVQDRTATIILLTRRAAAKAVRKAEAVPEVRAVRAVVPAVDQELPRRAVMAVHVLVPAVRPHRPVPVLRLRHGPR